LVNRLSPRVHKQYASSLRTIPFFSLEGFDSHFSKRALSGATGKTMNNELVVYKGYLRWLHSRGHSVSNALLTYPQFRHVPKKFRRALRAKEISRLRTVAGRRWAWWSFLLHTGLRKSEFERLAWSDVLEGSIRVRDSKNPLKQRLIPIHKELFKMLHTTTTCNGRLFKLPKSPSSMLRMFKKDLHRAGISKEIDLHCLRVTFISALARAGVGPRTAQELAGHSDIRTTLKIYTKVTDQDKVDAVNRLKF
jgi:integrase